MEKMIKALFALFLLTVFVLGLLMIVRGLNGEKAIGFVPWLWRKTQL